MKLEDLDPAAPAQEKVLYIFTQYDSIFIAPHCPIPRDGAGSGYETVEGTGLNIGPRDTSAPHYCKKVTL